MNRYSKASRERLIQCDKRLQKLFLSVLQHRDHSILCGYRGKQEQEQMFADRKTQLHYPHSKHNKTPSTAIDVAPYDKDMRGIDWDNREEFIYFAGLVKGIAHERGIPLKWGGDWSDVWSVKQNSFDDLVHFELIV